MRNLPGTWKYTGQKQYCCCIYSVFKCSKLTAYVCIYSMRPASERPVQPRSQCYKWRGWQFNTKGSPPPTGCVLSPKHHSHIQGKICLSINISHVMWFVRDSLYDRFLFFSPSRTLHIVVPSQYWTTSGRGGRAEPLLAQVRNSTWMVQWKTYKRLLERSVIPNPRIGFNRGCNIYFLSNYFFQLNCQCLVC